MINSIFIVFALFVFLVPKPALANVGLPMLVWTMPVMIVALLPIIVIEAYVIKKICALQIKKSLIYSGIANLVSTFTGIPTSYIILVVTHIPLASALSSMTEINPWTDVFINFLWMSPLSEAWMYMVAMMILLVPFFFVSWWTEYFVVQKLNKSLEKKLLKTAFFKANLLTYALLMLYPITEIILYFY